jgi:hypothetical protein
VILAGSCGCVYTSVYTAKHAQDPQMLGIEWSDGAPPSLYMSPSRDAILAGLLDAAQVRCSFCARMLYSIWLY